MRLLNSLSLLSNCRDSGPWESAIPLGVSCLEKKMHNAWASHRGSWKKIYHLLVRLPLRDSDGNGGQGHLLTRYD